MRPVTRDLRKSEKEEYNCFTTLIKNAIVVVI